MAKTSPSSDSPARPRGKRALRAGGSGFTYLTVLFIVAILMTGLALAGNVWETAAKREKEAQLLFVGNQYRNAIARYYESTPGGVKSYPRSLEDLLKDPRQPSTQRYLRKLFRDPFDAKEWGLVKAPDGGIAGVYSLSEEKPLKTGNFKLRDAGFEAAQRYADWKFIYSPAAAAQTTPRIPAPGPSSRSDRWNSARRLLFTRWKLNPRT